MNRYLYPYGISIGLHAFVFMVVALIANRQHLTPPILIDFTVSSAHALVEQQTATPAKPKPKSAPRPQPLANTPPLPQPAPVAQVHEENLQNISEVAVAKTTREASAHPVSSAPPSSRPAEGVKSAANNQSSGASEKVDEQARAKYVKEQFSYIRDKIASHVRYPRHARRMGWSGAVQVSFIIEEHGGVTEVRIVRGSQVGMLDDEALDSVKRSAPFPRPPVRARIIIPVEFVLG